jgi:hypothetical protein
MTTHQGEQRIRQFTRRVEEVERGYCRRGCPDREAAIQALLNDIFTAPWATPEERSRAQGLVARLERLQSKGPGGPATPVPAVVRPSAGTGRAPALTAALLKRWRETTARHPRKGAR